MGAGASTVEDPEAFKLAVLEKLKTVKEANPQNLCAKYLSEEYINSLDEAKQSHFYKCIATGLENPDSQLGCYAMTPDDYEAFGEFFDKVIRDYHGDNSGEKVHLTSWDLGVVKSEASKPVEGEATDTTPEKPKTPREQKEEDLAKEEEISKAMEALDLKSLGVDDLSMRVRVGRNLKSFNLPGNMDKDERVKFEKTMLQAFDKLKSMDEYGGAVYSLTPEFGEGEVNPNLIDEDKYKELVESHIMFKNMDEDLYLKTAGISSDWPYGRGCYLNKDNTFIVWFGEEDQLRIMCMKKGTNLAEVFDYLKKSLDLMESIEGIEFAKSDKYGYITSCPSNLGTGMRASVHLKVPKLIFGENKEGDLAKVKLVCDELNLSVRGVGGEHTAFGEDGTVDISPKQRLFITEGEIVQKLFAGVQQLWEKESSEAVADPAAA